MANSQSDSQSSLQSNPQFIAELTIGSYTAKVDLSDITMESCIARVTFSVKAFQQGHLQIHIHKAGERVSSFTPAKIIVESIKQKTGEVGVSYIKLKFRGMVNASQGIVQLLHSITLVSAQPQTPRIISTNNSLRLVTVSCPLCFEENIMFRALEKRTMLTKTNIFGVPEYIEAYPNRDFCDFNLVRIIVCSACYFASNDINEFVRISAEGEVKPAWFSANVISKNWLDTIDHRRKLVANNLNHFFDEERSLKQAIHSYELALISSDEISKIDEGRSSRARNFNPMRKSIYYLFMKAELLMRNSQAKEAEDALKDINCRLEFLFPFLKGVFSIRTAYQLGLINIYFENYIQAGKYIGFLNGYDKDEDISIDEDEQKELKKNLANLNEIFQNREDYSREKLNGFERPF